MFHSDKQRQFYHNMIDAVVAKTSEDMRADLLELPKYCNWVDAHHITSLMADIAYPTDRQGNFKRGFNEYVALINELVAEVTKLKTKQK